MTRLADSATPQERRASRPRPTALPDPHRAARREAVLIVRQGLAPYMRAHGLRMPPPTLAPTLAEVWADLKRPVVRAAKAYAVAARAIQNATETRPADRYTLAGPTEGDR